MQDFGCLMPCCCVKVCICVSVVCSPCVVGDPAETHFSEGFDCPIFWKNEFSLWCSGCGPWGRFIPGLIVVTVQHRGPIPAWGPQSGAAPQSVPLPPVTHPHSQSGLQGWLERLSGSPRCTFPSHPRRDQQSWSQGRVQSRLFLSSKFAKSKWRARRSPSPALGWGLQPSRCPSAFPANLYSAVTFCHTGDVCVWL